MSDIIGSLQVHEEIEVSQSTSGQRVRPPLRLERVTSLTCMELFDSESNSSAPVSAAIQDSPLVEALSQGTSDKHTLNKPRTHLSSASCPSPQYLGQNATESPLKSTEAVSNDSSVSQSGNKGPTASNVSPSSTMTTEGEVNPCSSMGNSVNVTTSIPELLQEDLLRSSGELPTLNDPGGSGEESSSTSSLDKLEKQMREKIAARLAKQDSPSKPDS